MTEQQPYDLVRSTPEFELRRYPPHVVAETIIRDGSFEKAGSSAFRLLFGYITGENAARQSIEMTAPVVQAKSTKIAMTAPVVQQQQGDGFVVAFVLPAAMTESSAPIPTHPEVSLRTVPEQLVAARRFSGRWSHSAWEAERQSLLAGVVAAGLTTHGDARFARFDPPYKPWFLRHNEVLIDVSEEA